MKPEKTEEYIIEKEALLGGIKSISQCSNKAPKSQEKFIPTWYLKQGYITLTHGYLDSDFSALTILKHTE